MLNLRQKQYEALQLYARYTRACREHMCTYVNASLGFPAPLWHSLGLRHSPSFQAKTASQRGPQPLEGFINYSREKPRSLSKSRIRRTAGDFLSLAVPCSLAWCAPTRPPRPSRPPGKTEARPRPAFRTHAHSLSSLTHPRRA